MKVKYLIFMTVYFVSSGETSDVKPLNILAIFPFHGKSHGIVFNSFINALLERGHNITVISCFSLTNQSKHYRHIDLGVPILEDAFVMEKSYFTILQVNKFLVAAGNDACKRLLENREVQKLRKKKEKFDLIIVEDFNSDCPLALAHKLDAPVIGLTSCSLMPWQYNKFGIPYNPSYVPFQFLEGGTKPSLYQRVERTIFHAYFNIYYRYVGQKTDEKTLQQYFDDIPPLEELAKNIKFLLLYTNFILFGSNGLPANVIEVQGYHIHSSKPLPLDLQKFIDESKQGVIYISFGSILKASMTDARILKEITSALAELPQRIIWKWEDQTVPGNLTNIYVSKWLPQRDILAHPNVVAFLSHCGLVGITEAITFGVPIVGLPVLGDQPSNAEAIEEKGFGVKLNLAEITKEKLLDGFNTVLDPNFRDRVKLQSKAWQDRPLTAMKNAIFWAEFAARNKNFTFRAASVDVPFYQYFCLDVLVVLITFIITCLYIIKYLILTLLSASPNKIKTT